MPGLLAGWARTAGAVKTKDTPTAREKLVMLMARRVSMNMIREIDLAIRQSLADTRHLVGGRDMAVCYANFGPLLYWENKGAYSRESICMLFSSPNSTSGCGFI